MKAMVVYDSVFGNTGLIAQSIGNAFGSQEDIETVQVSNVQPEQLTGLGLLIVGSPTRIRAAGELLRAVAKHINLIKGRQNEDIA